MKHQRSHIKNCGQPSDPIDTTTMNTFSPPPLAPDQHPCTLSPHRQHPCEHTRVGETTKFGQRLQHPCWLYQQRSILTVVDHPKLPPHRPYLDFLPAADAETEQQDNANRSMDCIGTATYMVHTWLQGSLLAAALSLSTRCAHNNLINSNKYCFF